MEVIFIYRLASPLLRRWRASPSHDGLRSGTFRTVIRITKVPCQVQMIAITIGRGTAPAGSFVTAKQFGKRWSVPAQLNIPNAHLAYGSRRQYRVIWGKESVSSGQPEGSVSKAVRWVYSRAFRSHAWGEVTTCGIEP